MEYDVHILDSVDMVDPRDPPPDPREAMRRHLEAMDREARRRLFEAAASNEEGSDA